MSRRRFKTSDENRPTVTGVPAAICATLSVVTQIETCPLRHREKLSRYWGVGGTANPQDVYPLVTAQIPELSADPYCR
jgi:hypothetical protein